MNLDNIKAGDFVALRRRRSFVLQDSPVRAEVQRTTATRIVIDGGSFMRKSGREVGGSAFNTDWIEPWDDAKHPAMIEEARASLRHEECANYLRNWRWHECSLETLESVLLAIGEKVE